LAEVSLERPAGHPQGWSRPVQESGKTGARIEKDLVVENLGYSVGFLIVTLSRQQLFTENTLTVVLPVIARKEWKWLPAMLRLWGIVLAANLVGCFLFAGLLAYSGALSPEIAEGIKAVGPRCS